MFVFETHQYIAAEECKVVGNHFLIITAKNGTLILQDRSVHKPSLA